MVPLVSICDFQGGTQPPKSEWISKNKDGYIQMLQIRDFTQERKETEYVPLKPNLKTCEEDDILIARYGASIGKILTGKKGAYNVAIIKTIPDEKKITKQYLYYYLKSSIFQSFVKNVGTRAAQAGFNKQDLKDLDIYLPSLENQMQIVELLQKAQFLIDVRKEQIETLSTLQQSMFLEIFGDPIKNTMDWKITKLGDIGKWKSGGTPSREQKEYFQGCIPWLSSGELNQLYTYSSNEHISEKAVEETSAKLIPVGSLLLGMYDTAGLKSTITKVECSCNQAIAFSNLDNGTVSTEYVYFTIQLLKEYLKNQQRGVRQKNFNLTMIKNIEIPLPPLNIQKKYEDIFLNIEKQKTLMEKSLLQLEENFYSLMQTSFKGELVNN
ncbi:restriction endonuclease subunit S [Bacillus sp. BHET2]|uniref:restriction endonuclease subunit S n=1 Tax=Bacillus sp. BHET2 TaxID=2583818 RepID=UPI001F0D0B08|nr:restriction endonuclease subunit S [Bacillus sp. BHET2]